MTSHKISFAAFLAMIFFTTTSFAKEDETLSLEKYLSQVKGENLEINSANQSAEAFEKLKTKAKLVTAINFFASTEAGFVEQNQALQILRYTKSYNRENQIGISQTSDFGLSTKLYYSINHIKYKNLTTSSTNPSLAASNYQSTPTIELSLPLWQNLFGKSTKSAKDSLYFSNEAQKLNSLAVSLSSLVASEQSYWGLVYARKAVALQQNSLNSAKQILNYVTNKLRLNLGETADVLQAKALVETRKLSLQQAQNNEKLSAREFNKNRYINSNEAPENLGDFDFAKINSFKIPQEKISNRLDVKSQEAQMKAAIADAKVTEESAKPSLSLYGAYSQNQIEPHTLDAINSTFNRKGRSGSVGLRLSMPINFSLNSEIQQGANLSALAAKTNYRQKVFEQENDWGNLVQNLAIYKENLTLAKAIENAQKLKLENERKLLKQGRTTTYQILLFEQEYLNAQLTTIEMAYKMLALIAEEKLYQN
jgi:outer membrane protein TolC